MINVSVRLEKLMDIRLENRMDIRQGKLIDKVSITLGKLIDECKHWYKKVNCWMMALDVEN